MLETVLVAVLPTLLTTAADLIKMFATANTTANTAQIRSQMQAAIDALTQALADLDAAHAKNVAELAAAQKSP
jgi:spore coat protein CotF